MRVFETLDEFKAAKGEQLGPSDWITITQEQINGFADATGDHQWIHTDPERAKAGPFGTAIAHGYLTLVADSELRYLTTYEYVAASATGVPYDDPALGIDWPASVELMSDNDRSWTPLGGPTGGTA
jgi:hypothetical protein